MKGKLWIKVIAALVIFGGIITGISSCTAVSSGHTGVVTNFGKVDNNIVSEGIYFKKPFVSKIVVMDNRVVKIEADSSAASKDLQAVKAKIAVNYHLNKTASASIYQNVGTKYQDVIVTPAIQESVKSVSAQYTSEELITKRQEVGDKIKAAIDSKINAYGLTVNNLNIIDFDFSAEFNKAIEAKQTATQNTLKAEQDLSRIKIEAQQQVIQAQAEADAMKLKSQQATPEMIQLEFIKKWDGKLPTVSGGNSILNATDLLNNTQGGAKK